MDSSNFKDELFEFYKECYYYELDRKDKIRQQLGLAIAVLALLGNSASYYFSNFQFLPFRFPHLWFYVPFTLGTFFALVAFIFLFYYFYLVGDSSKDDPPARTYTYIPTTEAIKAVINDFEEVNQSASEGVVRDFYIENLSEQYSKAATHNQLNNQKRTGYVFSSLKCSLISMLFLLLAFPGFFSLKREFSSHISQPVEVSTMNKQQGRPDKPNNSDANTSGDQAKIQEPVTASPDTSTVKVKWPPLQYIKENDERKVK